MVEDREIEEGKLIKKKKRSLIYELNNLRNELSACCAVLTTIIPTICNFPIATFNTVIKSTADLRTARIRMNSFFFYCCLSSTLFIINLMHYLRKKKDYCIQLKAKMPDLNFTTMQRTNG